MAENKLTDKQEKFCQEYLVDLNATQAAIRAGYSEHTANEQGSQLLAKLSIQERIAELQKKQIKRLEIKQDDIVKELAKVGFANMRNYAKWNADSVNLKDSEEELTEEQTAVVSEVSQTITKDGGTIRFKLHDKVKSLELLGKHVGVFSENFNVNLKNCGVVTDSDDNEDNLIHLPKKVPIGAPVNDIDNKEGKVE